MANYRIIEAEPNIFQVQYRWFGIWRTVGRYIGYEYWQDSNFTLQEARDFIEIKKADEERMKGYPRVIE